MERILFLLLFSVSILGATASTLAQDGVTVTVTVTNIPGVKGNLLIGLYDSEKTFLKKPYQNSPKIPVTSTDNVTATIENVVPGTYAVSVIQDLNGNGKLDKSFVGIPKEPLAFSVIKEIPKGRPKFGPCSFEVKDKDIQLTISLVTE